MPRWFGTDGIRGRMFEYPLVPEVFNNIGYHFGKRILEGGVSGCLLARDTREGGDELAGSLARGLAAAGVRVFDAGVFPTPAAILVATELHVCAAVVTASHNPYPDNGLKLIGPGGRKISAEDEDYLESRFDVAPDLAGGSGAIEPFESEAAARYLKLVREKYPDLTASPEVHLILDVAHGAASAVYPRVLKSFGYSLTVCNDQPTGRNINENCGAVHPDHLLARIGNPVPGGAPETLDRIGFCYDGDGDRMLGAVPGYGLWDGHRMLAAGALYLHAGPGLGREPAVVSTVMANQALETFLADYGIRLIRTPVGDKHLYAALREKDLVLGAEPSGHLIRRTHSPTGDGLLTTLLFLEILEKAPEILGLVLREYRPFPQVLKNVPAAVRPPLERLTELQRCTSFHAARLGSEGRIYIRYSGTEPVLRILVEAREAAVAYRIARDLEDAAVRDFRRFSPDTAGRASIPAPNQE